MITFEITRKNRIRKTFGDERPYHIDVINIKVINNHITYKNDNVTPIKESVTVCGNTFYVEFKVKDYSDYSVKRGMKGGTYIYLYINGSDINNGISDIDIEIRNGGKYILSHIFAILSYVSKLIERGFGKDDIKIETREKNSIKYMGNSNISIPKIDPFELFTFINNRGAVDINLMEQVVEIRDVEVENYNELEW